MEEFRYFNIGQPLVVQMRSQPTPAQSSETFHSVALLRNYFPLKKVIRITNRSVQKY